jgi:hypothetical protein
MNTLSVPGKKKRDQKQLLQNTNANTNIIRYSIPKQVNLNIYNRLRVQNGKEGYKPINPTEFSYRIANVILGLPPAEGKLLSEFIYVIIMHHEKLNGSIYREVCYGGSKLSKGGVSIPLNSVPRFIQQLLRNFIDEITYDECPEQYTNPEDIEVEI